MTTPLDCEKKQEAEMGVEYFKECGYSAKRKGATILVTHKEDELKTVNEYWARFKKYVLCGIM